MNRPRLTFVFVLAASGIAACSSSSSSQDATGALEQASTGCAVNVNPALSLFVTDSTALAGFPLQAVMDQIVATGSNTGQTSLGLYQQMLDTLNTAAGGVTKGPHCDDQKVNGVPAINGFPEQFCPRQEGALAKTDPFTKGSQDSYVTLGLVNRFDLAPRNGANCGQYRIVYGKLSGQANAFDRMLIIFEAVLPNPDPTAGLAGCLPVAQFWDNLSADPSATDRAAKLKGFYFSGLPGFVPVVRAQNYGIGGGTNTGQIRTNMFMFQTGSQEWELREFRLSQTCGGTSCSLTADNTFVQDNPFGLLFGGTDSVSLAFQKEFITQVPHLAAKSINGITMSTPTVDDGPQSDEQAPTNNDYLAQGQNNTTLLANIQAKLVAIGRTDLTPDNILDRATTQSCAGCHELSVGRNLGPTIDGGTGLVWPASNGFTQINEFSQLSPALTGTFLPHRAAVLKNFINAHCATDGGTSDGGAPQLDPTETLGGSAVGAAN